MVRPLLSIIQDTPTPRPWHLTGPPSQLIPMVYPRGYHLPNRLIPLQILVVAPHPFLHRVYPLSHPPVPVVHSSRCGQHFSYSLLIHNLGAGKYASSDGMVEKCHFSPLFVMFPICQVSCRFDFQYDNTVLSVTVSSWLAVRVTRQTRSSERQLFRRVCFSLTCVYTASLSRIYAHRYPHKYPQWLFSHLVCAWDYHSKAMTSSGSEPCDSCRLFIIYSINWLPAWRVLEKLAI